MAIVCPGFLELTATGIVQVSHLILFSFETRASNTFRMQKYKEKRIANPQSYQPSPKVINNGCVGN